MMRQTELTVITADYEKFFDTFDANFFAQLCIRVGFPPKVANLVKSVNTKMKLSKSAPVTVLHLQ